MSQASSAPRDDETPAGRGPLIQGGPLGRVLGAIETVLTEGPRTPDIGGSATTREVGQAIAAAL